MVLARLVALSVTGVLLIASVVTEVEMGRIAAKPHIAMMQNVGSLRNRPICERPSGSMSATLAGTRLKTADAVSHRRARQPNPAWAKVGPVHWHWPFLVDLVPEGHQTFGAFGS